MLEIPIEKKMNQWLKTKSPTRLLHT